MCTQTILPMPPNLISAATLLSSFAWNGHRPFHGCNYFSLLGSATPIMRWSCLGWTILLPIDATILTGTQLPLNPEPTDSLSTNVITVMCSFKKHCQFFTWKEYSHWLTDWWQTINQPISRQYLYLFLGKRAFSTESKKKNRSVPIMNDFYCNTEVDKFAHLYVLV